MFTSFNIDFKSTFNKNEGSCCFITFSISCWLTSTGFKKSVENYLFCDITWYPAGNSPQQMGHQAMDMVSNNGQVSCGIYMLLNCLIRDQKYTFSYLQTPEQLFQSGMNPCIYDVTMQILHQNSADQATFFKCLLSSIDESLHISLFPVLN